jgi:cell fate regulator YaaT (PSP1 superfamily)
LKGADFNGLRIMSQQDDTTTEHDHQPAEDVRSFYRIRFRDDGQEYTASASMADLKRGDTVMIKTDHGLEPARVFGSAPADPDGAVKRAVSCEISRRPTSDEENRFLNLASHEQDAFAVCERLIEKHDLVMRLINVEKFFNGSKMIFYFTADNRVDFRALVKDLVQEFRTRVEMRQVGVRHETKMIGGVGICGRELCCSSFMKKFDSVSIKMAKEQDLPLNPAKISGVCNRLLCCLTYEYDIYRKQRKGMPKVGRKIKIGSEIYRVKRQNPLQQSLLVGTSEGEERLLSKEQWGGGELLPSDKTPKRNGRRPSSDPDTGESGGDNTNTSTS